MPLEEEGLMAENDSDAEFPTDDELEAALQSIEMPS
jgi:hypothetical protein